jgi:hypothetical protein
MNGGGDDARGFPICAYSGFVIQREVLAASEFRYVVITSSIPLNRMARRIFFLFTI